MKTKTPNVSGRSAWLRDNITKYFSFSAIIILLVALSLTQDNFLGTSNLKNLLRDTAPLMIMSAGMTMVLLFGSIDLSMGAVCSVSNVTYIHLMLAFQDSFSNPFLTSLAAMAVSLAFGLASGLALGIIHVKLKVPSFIASLGFTSRDLLATRADILARLAYSNWDMPSWPNRALRPSLISIRSFLPKPRACLRLASRPAVELAPPAWSLTMAMDSRVVKVWRYSMLPRVHSAAAARIRARIWNL